MKRIAIIDLGTNTFQLLVVEYAGTAFNVLYEGSQAAKIGKGGISDGRITPDAIDRAIGVLSEFRTITDAHGVVPEHITAIATSAVRSASNRAEFEQAIWSATAIRLKVIQGDEEAGLIYDGVKLGMSLRTGVSMIMDIGGGSVEFILCNQKRMYWKQSFEIGGQRLMDKFMTADPIPAHSMSRLYSYLEEVLLPLTNAVHQYEPTTLVGSAGSFETLVDLYFMHTQGQLPPAEQVAFELPISEFYRSFQLLLTNDRQGRMNMPGMKDYRVDMIVVGACLIDFVLKKYQISQLNVSNYSLKEGVLARLLNTSL
ncbi:MAG: phosphatase [Spirosomataceae bacterium]